MRLDAMTAALIAAVTIAAATPAAADRYYIAIARKDAVSLYDLTTLRKMGDRFSVWQLTVKDPPWWPTSSGRVAYAMQREDYDCATSSYEAPIFKEFGPNGEPRGATDTPDSTGRYRHEVLPGNPEDALFHYVCNSSVLMRDHFQQRNHARIITVASPVSAFQTAEMLMIKTREAAAR